MSPDAQTQQETRITRGKVTHTIHQPTSQRTMSSVHESKKHACYDRGDHNQVLFRYATYIIKFILLTACKWSECTKVALCCLYNFTDGRKGKNNDA